MTSDSGSAPVPETPTPLSQDLAVRNGHELAEVETVEDAKALYDKLEAFARHYQHDHEKQNLVAEAKLRTARKGGELLRVTVQHGGSRSRDATLPEGFTKSMSSRWQTLAGISEDDFEEHLETRRDEGYEITLASALAFARTGIHFSSETGEWETPQDLFDLLDREFGFALDVCASEGNAKCPRYFTAEQDGLGQEWSGVCWMNPPYGTVIGAWVRKAYESAKAGATVVCLLPARVDTGWWWEFVRYGEIRFLRGRLKFGGGETSAPFPSAVVVFPHHPRVVWWEEAA